MKLLYILNQANKVNNFSYSSMIAAQECGLDFHIAGNWGYKTNEDRENDEKKYNIKIHQIDFIRNPLNPKNIIAYKELVNLIEREKYDVIHCNTPVGGLLGRLAGSKCKVKTIIYQAHGFHFYKGAPLINWLLYYPVEKFLAHKTDVLITINTEDYDLAKKKMHLRKGGEVYYVPGVGIDLKEFIHDDLQRKNKRNELGLHDDDIAIISMGDLIARKNYSTAITAIAKTKNSKINYYVCGDGPEKQILLNLTKKLGIQNQIHFLGYRNDIKELLNASDIFLLTSKQEGLARSLMEGMAAGLPCIASNVRGNADLLSKGGGFLCKMDAKDFAEKINVLASSKALMGEKSEDGLKGIINCEISLVIASLYSIYLKLS